jgi:hypothetical protein
MSHQTPVLDRLARQNPVPNPADPPSGAWDLDAVRLELMRREDTMLTKERPTTTSDDGRRPIKGWLVASTAFAAVLVFGVIAFTGGDPVTTTTPPGEATTTAPTTATTDPPTTDPTTASTETPTTTTTTIDPVVEANLQVANDFMEARAEGDVGAATALAAEGQIHLGLVDSLGTMPDELAWLNAVGWETSLAGCEVTLDDPANTWVACTVTFDTAWARALDRGTYDVVYRVRVNMGEHGPFSWPDLTEPTVTEVQAGILPAEFRSEVWGAFAEWLAAEHPDDVDQLLLEVNDCDGCIDLLPGQRSPRVTADTLDLWEQRAAEFVESISGE